MPATLTREPVCAPPGARAVPKAPSRGWHCTACECDPGCKVCHGTFEQFPDWLLPRSRTHGYRRAQYDPVRRLLTVECARRSDLTATAATYSVQPVECDWPGAAFILAKLHSDRVHEVHVGPDGVTCSCEGHTYLTSAKRNQKAHECGAETFPGFGCVHADSLAALVAAGGWFDLPEPTE